MKFIFHFVDGSVIESIEYEHTESGYEAIRKELGRIKDLDSILVTLQIAKNYNVECAINPRNIMFVEIHCAECD